MAEIQGENNWVRTQFYNFGRTQELSIKEAQNDKGKFYDFPKKGDELKDWKINDIKVPLNEAGNIAACGRDSSPTGTNGSFLIYSGNDKVCRIEWAIPYSAVYNVYYRIKDKHSKWLVEPEFFRDGSIPPLDDLAATAAQKREETAEGGGEIEGGSDFEKKIGAGGPGAYIGNVRLIVNQFRP